MVKVGETYDDYLIIEDLGRGKSNQRWFKLVCIICGHEKVCSSSNITRQDNHHGWHNCKYDYYKEIVGKTINDYYIKDIFCESNRGYQATMVCNVCGHEKTLHVNKIKNSGATSHSASSCQNDYWLSFIGKQFGDLLIKDLGDTNPFHRTFICECVRCGTMSERMCNSVLSNRGVEHGVQCIKAIEDDEYKKVITQRFFNMVDRCNNPKNEHYDQYGGRGIKMKYEYPVDLYRDFIDELKEHSKVYGIKNSTFDRIDVNGNYEKENLRIVNKSVQSTNTRRRRFFLASNGNDIVLCDSSGEFYRKYGVPKSAIGNAVRKCAKGGTAKSYGWTVHKTWDSLTEEEIENIIVTEGVTTNLLITV